MNSIGLFKYFLFLVSECVEGEVISCKRVGPFRKIKTCVVQDGKYCESESTKKTREPWEN